MEMSLHDVVLRSMTYMKNEFEKVDTRLSEIKESMPVSHPIETFKNCVLLFLDVMSNILKEANKILCAVDDMTKSSMNSLGTPSSGQVMMSSSF